MEEIDYTRFQNSIRLQILINSTATQCLREIFSKEWTAHTNKTWENSISDGSFFIKSHGSKIYNNSKFKKTQEVIESGNLNRWDLLLLVQAIKILPVSKLTMSEKARNKRLDTLRDVRNEFSHAGSSVIPDNNFEATWSNITSVLSDFGVSAQDMENLRTMSFGRTDTFCAAQLEAFTGSLPDPNLTRAMDLKYEGNTLFKEKKFQEAIAKYSEAIKEPSLSFEHLAALYSNRSVAFHHLEDFKSAKSDAKGVILMNPSWSKGYFRLAAAYEGLSKFSNARKNYELANALEPGNNSLKNHLERIKVAIAKISRDDHLNPIGFKTTAQDSASHLNDLGLRTSAYKLLNVHRFSKAMGLSDGLCADGHNYQLGNGRRQDYVEAAKCYAKAAYKGSAEGFYNLALLTIEGKGVEANHVEAIRLLRQAASQENIINFMGQGLRNVGKAEAEHCLGLWHQYGTGVPKNLKLAVKWYKEAIRHGMGSSCNNLALLYRFGNGVPCDVKMAVELWKLGSYYRSTRAIECLTYHYFDIGDPVNGWNWYDFAVAEGSVSVVLRKPEFEEHCGEKSNTDFDAKEFRNDLKVYVLSGPLKEYVCPSQEIAERILAKQGEESLTAGNGFKTALIISHRKGIQMTARENKQGYIHFSTPGGISRILQGITDLFGLKQIFLGDMVATEDHIYEGFVLKLTIIEDALIGRPSIPLIVEDEENEVGRVFIYNYPQEDRIKIQDTLGFGCKISIVNPYLRIAADGFSAIRIDDPSTIFFHAHLREKSRCRFCGKNESSVLCRKCKRCGYCSKKCLMDDAKLWHHEFICKKHM